MSPLSFIAGQVLQLADAFEARAPRELSNRCSGGSLVTYRPMMASFGHS